MGCHRGALERRRHQECWQRSVRETVVLEGTIVSGDYDKLLGFVIARNTRTGSIYLASPGGSVSEAIKIGRLIRELKLRTTLPVRYDQSEDLTRDDIATLSEIRSLSVKAHNLTHPDSNYMCGSACFFAYVGGISRDPADDFPAAPFLASIDRT
jgi:hypothetical protein